MLFDMQCGSLFNLRRRDASQILCAAWQDYKVEPDQQIGNNIMKCSVVIPTKLRAGLLSGTLDALAVQTAKDFEAIVVCDGEDPETRALASRYSANFPLAWIFHPEPRGPAATRNTGALAARTRLLLFLDDDTFPCPDWIFQHCKHFAAPEKGDDFVVYGKVLEEYTRPPRSHTERFLRGLRDSILAEMDEVYGRMELDFARYACVGLNCSMQRNCFLAAGRMDPALQHIGEDSEFGICLYNLGIRPKFEPLAIVHHQSAKDMVEYFHRAVYLGGRGDVYRVGKKNERSIQTLRFASFHCGSAVRRIRHRLAWGHPKAFRRAAALCQKLTDFTGLPFLFELWKRLAAAEYWEGVRAEGIGLESLARLVPPSTPALMFHSISSPLNAEMRPYCLPPARFRQFMNRLKVAGYSSTEPIEWLSGRAPRRSVMLTFDDGYDDFYREAFPTLERLRLTATVFVVVDRLGRTNTWDEVKGIPSRRLLTTGQIREMNRHGVRIGSHSLTHPDLTSLSDVELEREALDSKSRLEDLLGSEVSSFAYPYGLVDARVRCAVVRAGYKTAMTTSEGLNCWEDAWSLKRIIVSDVDTLMGFMLKLATGKDHVGRVLASFRSRILRDPPAGSEGDLRADPSESSEQSAR